MRKSLICGALLLFATAHAQEINVPEPEFVNSYCILTSDSTYDILPKESGSMGEHKNKVSKWSRVAGGLASAAGAAGAVGIVTAGSLSGLNAGFRVMNAASGLSTVADVAEGLAGSYGMDIVFKGKSSSYSCTPNDGKIRLIVRGENNDADPMELYRIVRFNSSKKERRIQWMEIKPALLGSKEADKAGYVAFDAHKYGESSYIITTKADQIEEGEYGIIFMNASLSTVIPIATFSVN